jgi:hypothetical protein
VVSVQRQLVLCGRRSIGKGEAVRLDGDGLVFGLLVQRVVAAGPDVVR